MTDSTARHILIDAFDRVHEQIPALLRGLSSDDLSWQPGRDANPIGWLVWHLTRVQDDHLATLATTLGRATEQVWPQWRGRFALAYDADAIGYGQNAADVGGFHIADPALLTGYHEQVHELTRSVLAEIGDGQLAAVVDDAWNPPVTAAARLVSVIGDTTAHAGQAAYVKGLLQRR